MEKCNKHDYQKKETEGFAKKNLGYILALPYGIFEYSKEQKENKVNLRD